MKLDANSFLFTDDNKGIVYLVRKKGTKTQIAMNENEPVMESDVPVNAEAPVPNGSRSCLSIVLLFAGAFLRTIV
jgi:hypothetical protein